MSEQTPERVRYVKPGEMLAMASTRLHQDRRGFFWMFGGSTLPNERKGDVTIVHIRGELEHHKIGWGESYEGILEKFRAAYTGQDAVDAHERAHRWDDDFAPLECAPPAAIVVCIDSPGGVVSGLNECVAELQRMRAEHPKIPVTAYVNEQATSAAYALACSCDEIVCPESAIIGSIGVISTMISQEARDKKEGFDVRLLTSGARKADGHLHAPISDDAIKVETERVDKLALSFFRLAAKARKKSVKEIQSLQAGIFLGKDAIRVGLADRLAAYSDLLAPKGETMDLAALIKSTKAALAKEDDPAKIASLSATLGAYSAALDAYKKTEKYTETTEVKETKSEEDGDEEPEEKAEGSAAASDEPEGSAAASDDEDDEDEDEAKAAKKALALVESITEMKGKKALGALQAIAMTAANAAKDVAALKKNAATTAKATLIASAKGKYLTASEAKWLATQKPSVVEGFVEMRKKAGVIVHTDDSTIVKPKAAAPGTEDSLPKEVIEMIDAAVAGASGDKKKIRAELVEAHLKTHNEQIAARALNGSAGRY